MRVLLSLGFGKSCVIFELQFLETVKPLLLFYVKFTKYQNVPLHNIIIVFIRQMVDSDQN